MTSAALRRSRTARWGGRSSRNGRNGWTATLAVVLCWATSAGAADAPVRIYQWTDSKGVYRYTPILERIPEQARHTVVTIEAGEEPAQNTPIYFEPDPRAALVAVPDQPPEAAASGAVPGAPAQAGGDAIEYDERIRVLEAQIAEFEDALKQMIDTPGADADIEVPPELREIAARLPRLQAELAALERGRAAVVGP